MFDRGNGLRPVVVDGTEAPANAKLAEMQVLWAL